MKEKRERKGGWSCIGKRVFRSLKVSCVLHEIAKDGIGLKNLTEELMCTLRKC